MFASVSLSSNPLRRWRLAACVGALGISVATGPVAAQCTGDCDGDGRVAINELVAGVNIVLDAVPLARCPSFDRDGNKAVRIDELVAAVGDVLKGCTTAIPTTAGPRATPTVTPTPTPTRVNQRPVAQCLDVYRTYPGYPIALPIEASDPDGDPLRYAADQLPAGAQLDELTGLFTWTPADDQLGPFYVVFTVTDGGSPPLSTQGQLVFRVSPLDRCAAPTCDPATGCTAGVVSLEADCCVGQEVPRVAEPLADCPEGRVVHIGRNTRQGFGRLQNCDRFLVLESGQSNVRIRFHVEARCLNFDDDRGIVLQARLETAHRLVVENNPRILLRPRGDGFSQRLNIDLPLLPPPPYFELEGAEATLRVILTDADGVSVSETVRLILTFDRDTGDFPDVDDEGPVPPFVICGDGR